MQSEVEFRVLLALVMVAFVAHRGYYHRKCRVFAEGATDAERGKLASAVAGALGALGLLATMVYIVDARWLTWSAAPLPDWLRWVGLVLALAGFVLLHLAQRALGTNWSESPRMLDGQTMVAEGPYRSIRHPIYTAFLLILAAPLLLSANWFIGSAWLAMTGLEVSSRIRVEEDLMTARFGDRYRRYRAVTGALLPRLSWRGRTGPDT